MLVSKNPNLACENSARKGRTKTILFFPSCNVIMGEPLRKLENDVSLLFLLGIFGWNKEKKVGTALKKILSRFCK